MDCVQFVLYAFIQKELESSERGTRGMSSSWALFKGVTIQDICEAASWSSPHTFARFYKRNVTAQTLAHAVLSVRICDCESRVMTRSALDVMIAVGRRLRGRLSGNTGVRISHSETPKRMLEREQ